LSGDLIAPPATGFAAEVRRLLDQCSPVVAAHSERSYQFAAAFAATDGAELDDEVLYLGTVLHDIGLSPAADGDERFEVRGSGAEALEPALVRRVLDRWPRHDFPTEFESVLADEVRAHPDSVRMSWLESVASVHA
jgi:hypothetical protein